MTSAAVAAASWGRARWKSGVGLAAVPGPLMSPAGNDPDGGTGDLIALKVEIFINSAWTDITEYVRRGGSITISRGRSDETSQVQPQTARMTLDDRDGRFSARNPTGPYYGQLTRNTPLRVSRLNNGIRRYRFYGEVPAWPSASDISGRESTVAITASGMLRRLRQGNTPLRSALYRTYALSPTPGYPQPVRPIAYWPCEEGQNATSIASGLSGGIPLTVTGSPTFATDTTFVCSQPLPQLSASTWTGAIPSHTPGPDNVLRFLLSIPAAGEFDGAVVARLRTSGPTAILDLQYGSSSNGQLKMTGYDASGTQLFTSGYFTPSVAGPAGSHTGLNGMPVFVSMELHDTGSGINYAIRFLPLLSIFGVVFTSFPVVGDGARIGGATVATLGSGTTMTIAPDRNLSTAAVGHVIYQSTVDALSVVAHQFNAWTLDPPASRFTRLCQEQNVSSATILATEINAGDPVTLGYQLDDTFANLIAEPSTANAGLLFESRDQLALVFRERGTLYSQSAHLTLDLAQHHLSAPLIPVDDDALTRNDVTVTRVGGSSFQLTQTTGTLSTQQPPDGVGDYQTSYELSLGTDLLTADEAGWRLHLGTVDEPRYPQVGLNLRYPAFTSSLDLMNAALTLDIGDRLDIVNPPSPQFPPDPISQVVQGYTEVLGNFEHSITFNCSPASPYNIGYLDDAVYGHADTDGSTLVGDYPLGTETTLRVATTGAATGSPLWTTSAGDFPFDINIGGERMTVTAITGAASPQTFTVTRSVNTVVKSQASGTDVRLWQPMYTSV